MYSRQQHTSWFQIKLLRCVCSLSAILINLQKKCFRRRHYQKWIWVRLYNVSSWDKCWARNGFWWFGRNAICQNSRFRFSLGLLVLSFRLLIMTCVGTGREMCPAKLRNVTEFETTMALHRRQRCSPFGAMRWCSVAILPQFHRLGGHSRPISYCSVGQIPLTILKNVNHVGQLVHVQPAWT